MTSPDEREDMAEALATFLEESGHTERAYEYTRAHDAADSYRERHPDAPEGMARQTLRALADLEAHCPAHLRARVWPETSA